MYLRYRLDEQGKRVYTFKVRKIKHAHNFSSFLSTNFETMISVLVYEPFAYVQFC